MRVTQSLLSVTTVSALIFGSIPAAQAHTQSVTPVQKQQAAPKSTTEVVYNGKSILKINLAVAKDPITHQATSWVDAYGLQSVIRSLGIEAHWVAGVNQLVLIMPAGWTMTNMAKLSYHNPQPGQFATIINSVTVGYGRTLSQKGVGGATSTFLPVGYIMNILNHLGIHSTWTPSRWQLSGTVNVADAKPMSGDYSQTFSLQLGNNSDVSLPEPPVPPLPPVSVTLPMNSALKPSSIKFMASESYPMEDYVQVGTSDYMAYAPITSVERWFSTAYMTQGYVQTGSGSAGNIKTGEHSESFVYVPKIQPSDQEITVTMSFEETAAHQTLVEYYVTDVVVPPRPSSSLVTGDVTQIDVSLKTDPLNGASTTQTASVTDSDKITGIVNAVNALTHISPPGVGSTPQADRYQLTFTLKLSDGSTLTVTEAKLGDYYYPVVVGNVPLTDSKGTVWNAVLSAMKSSTLG